MIPWDVVWPKDVADELRHLDRRLTQRIRDRVSIFSLTGQGDVRKLVGRENEYRLRVGEWRVIFTLDQGARTLIILGVHPRGSAYRD